MTEPRTWEEAIAHVTKICDELAIDRHRKYGPANIEATGEMGLWVRILDKGARLSMTMTGGAPADFDDEKFEDAIVDIVNYARFWLMYRRGMWDLPAECLRTHSPEVCPTCESPTRADRREMLGRQCQDGWHLTYPGQGNVLRDGKVEGRWAAKKPARDS